MESEKALIFDVADGIMTITLNRPQAKNAINLELAEGMSAALTLLDERADINVAIITGAGGVFSSGMDLKAFVSGQLPHVEGRGFGGIVEAPPKKPLIAAVEGYALAGGLEVMLSCDLIVAGDTARFGIPEVKRGLAAAAGGLMRLPRKIPQHLALEMALTGDFIDVQRAAAAGLVNRVVSAGTALDTAKELARIIAANGPMAVQVSKQVIYQSADWTNANMWERQATLVNPVLASEDANEGARAFAEKRAPNWQGK